MTTGASSRAGHARGQGHATPKHRTRPHDFAWDDCLWIPALASFFLLILPQFIFLRTSFYADLGLGQVSDRASLSNYVTILTDPFFVRAIVQTVYLSLAATLISSALALPTAYALAQKGGRTALICLSAILTTSLITVVIKLMGLTIVLSQTGLINRMLSGLGLIERPLILMNNEIGVLIGLVHYTLPILILLLFGVVQTVPRYLEEAAEIHGAPRRAVFFRVVLPIVKNGLVSGGLVAFNMSMGAFTSAALMGGGKVLIIPILIQQLIIQRAEYGKGAALSALLLVFVFSINLAAGWWFARKRQRDLLALRPAT
jgi:putative spermidine/putrescine transport system permease protein